MNHLENALQKNGKRNFYFIEIAGDLTPFGEILLWAGNESARYVRQKHQYAEAKHQPLQMTGVKHLLSAYPLNA